MILMNNTNFKMMHYKILKIQQPPLVQLKRQRAVALLMQHFKSDSL